jgi:hypothetical protein
MMAQLPLFGCEEACRQLPKKPICREETRQCTKILVVQMGAMTKLLLLDYEEACRERPKKPSCSEE